MENNKIQEIDLKLPKNAKLFYVPDRHVYVLRHYETNVLIATKEGILHIENEVSNTTNQVLYSGLRYLGLDTHIMQKVKVTNKNKFTQAFNKMSQEEKQEYSNEYNKEQWNKIAEQIPEDLVKFYRKGIIE